MFVIIAFDLKTSSYYFNRDFNGLSLILAVFRWIQVSSERKTDLSKKRQDSGSDRVSTGIIVEFSLNLPITNTDAWGRVEMAKRQFPELDFTIRTTTETNTVEIGIVGTYILECNYNTMLIVATWIENG